MKMIQALTLDQHNRSIPVGLHQCLGLIEVGRGLEEVERVGGDEEVLGTALVGRLVVPRFVQVDPGKGAGVGLPGDRHGGLFCGRRSTVLWKNDNF